MVLSLSLSLSLSIITKGSILDVAAVLDPLLSSYFLS